MDEQPPTDRPDDAAAAVDAARDDGLPDADLPDAEPTGDVLPVDLRDWVDFSVDEARRTRVFRTDALQQDLWCIEPQQATEVLRYEATDVTYTVLAGRAWFVTEQGDAGLDPLASLLVPAGVTHGIDNRAPDPLVVLAVGSPPCVATTPPAGSAAG